jgi:hypothetical protein
MSGLPEGAQEAVEELAAAISVPINDWLDSTTDANWVKRSVVMSALNNSLVMWSILYEVPAEMVIKSVITCLGANGAFGDDDDDEVVH